MSNNGNRPKNSNRKIFTYLIHIKFLCKITLFTFANKMNNKVV